MFLSFVAARMEEDFGARNDWYKHLDSLSAFSV